MPSPPNTAAPHIKPPVCKAIHPYAIFGSRIALSAHLSAQCSAHLRLAWPQAHRRSLAAELTVDQTQDKETQTCANANGGSIESHSPPRARRSPDCWDPFVTAWRNRPGFRLDFRGSRSPPGATSAHTQPHARVVVGPPISEHSFLSQRDGVMSPPPRTKTTPNPEKKAHNLYLLEFIVPGVSPEVNRWNTIGTQSHSIVYESKYSLALYSLLYAKTRIQTDNHPPPLTHLFFFLYLFFLHLFFLHLFLRLFFLHLSCHLGRRDIIQHVHQRNRTHIHRPLTSRKSHTIAYHETRQSIEDPSDSPKARILRNYTIQRTQRG